MELTDELLVRVPVEHLRVPLAGRVWADAERLNHAQAGHAGADWYPAGVVAACRWLADAIVEDPRGRRMREPAPATRRQVRAYEELVEAEYLAAEQLDVRRPDLVTHRPGWCEGIRATLRWAWRREGPAPLATTAATATR